DAGQGRDRDVSGHLRRGRQILMPSTMLRLLGWNFSALCLLVVAGCGSGTQQFTVNGLTLNATDQLYLSRPAGDFCAFAPTGQIEIHFNDYSPACILDRQVDAP